MSVDVVWGRDSLGLSGEATTGGEVRQAGSYEVSLLRLKRGRRKFARKTRRSFQLRGWEVATRQVGCDWGCLRQLLSGSTAFVRSAKPYVVWNDHFCFIVSPSSRDSLFMSLRHILTWSLLNSHC